MIVLGLLLLALAAVGREPPRPSGQSTLGAVGASMGGMRVVVIDGLFFRAEALRRRGRLEDAAGLYHAILELDPANEAATIFLADLFVDGLLPGAVDAQSRFLWWREAHGVLQDALARRPRSAPLHDRTAALIVRLPLGQPDLEPRLAKELGNWRLEALRHLGIAFEEVATLPRRGRGHIRHAALLAPYVASLALAAGDMRSYGEAVRIGRRLQSLRGEILDELLIDSERPERLGTFLGAALDAVEDAAAWRAAPSAARRTTALAALDRVEALQPDLRWTRRLRELLDGPR